MNVKKMISSIVFAFLIVLSISTGIFGKEYLVSNEVKQICNEIGNQDGICPELLIAIIEKESAGNPNAENNGCKGLMQISERWHTGRMAEIGADDIWSETDNIHIGANYLHELFSRYEDVALVLMVYNGESDAAEKAENGYISDYARKILDRSAELERWKGK